MGHVAREHQALRVRLDSNPFPQCWFQAAGAYDHEPGFGKTAQDVFHGVDLEGKIVLRLKETHGEKQRLVRDKFQHFLTQKVPSLQSIGPDQSVVIGVHIFNANPVDAPNLPSQLVFKVKKQEPANVTVREL